jgi:hypothetical protein
MKRSQLYGDFDKDTYDHTKNHLRMMGKDATTTDAKALLEAIVRNNPRFPENEDIAEVVNAFYSSVHYGSTELRSSTLMAHTRSFNAWLEGRATIRPKEQPITSGAAPPKPDNWQYDPNEPLPADITPERATHLLFALAQWRGTNVAEWRGKDHKIIPVGSADGWQHYINKLKDRAKKRA